MKMLKLIAVLGLGLSLAQPGVADVRKSGLTRAAFLKIGVGARPVALGSAIRPWPATSISYSGTQPVQL